MGMRWVMMGGVLPLTGCQTLDKAMKTDDSAVNAVNTGTMRNITQIARSQDPASALKQQAKERGEYYKGHLY